MRDLAPRYLRSPSIQSLGSQKRPAGQAAFKATGEVHTGLSVEPSYKKLWLGPKQSFLGLQRSSCLTRQKPSLRKCQPPLQSSLETCKQPTSWPEDRLDRERRERPIQTSCPELPDPTTSKPAIFLKQQDSTGGDTQKPS